MDLLVECHDDLWKHSRKQLKHFLVSREQKNLHHFRTSVKRLNALFHLLNFTDKEFNSTYYLKRLNKIFKHAGELRDDYITEQLAKTYAIDGWLIPDNKKNQEEHFERLKESYRNNTTHSSNTKLKVINQLKKRGVKELELFAEHILNQIKTGISAPEYTNDFHQIRKNIKEYLFINKLLETKKIKATKQEEIIFFEKLQNLIGDKHDIEKLLKRTSKLEQNPQLQKGIKKIKQDEKKLTRQIESAFKSWAKKSKHD